jgi:hypothetical protein
MSEEARRFGRLVFGWLVMVLVAVALVSLVVGHGVGANRGLKVAKNIVCVSCGKELTGVTTPLKVAAADKGGHVGSQGGLSKDAQALAKRLEALEALTNRVAALELNEAQLREAQNGLAQWAVNSVVKYANELTVVGRTLSNCYGEKKWRKMVDASAKELVAETEKARFDAEAKAKADAEKALAKPGK